MKYAKYISETTIDFNIPRRARYNDCEYAGDLSKVPGLLESLGYLPVEETEIPEVEDGFHAEARYAVDNGKIVQSWISVENPKPAPRSLSKRKLYTVLKNFGIWGVVKAYMEEKGVWEDWEYATTLDEDDQLIVSAISAIKASLGLSDADVEGILSQSVAE